MPRRRRFESDPEIEAKVEEILRKEAEKSNPTKYDDPVHIKAKEDARRIYHRSRLHREKNDLKICEECPHNKQCCPPINPGDTVLFCGVTTTNKFNKHRGWGFKPYHLVRSSEVPQR